MGNDEKETEGNQTQEENKAGVVRRQLSPHSDNIQLPHHPSNHADGKKVHFAAGCEDTEGKKPPRLVRKRGSGEDNLENESRAAERGKSSRAGPRKRSYSFSDIKHQPQTIKRWKNGRGGGGGRGRGGVNVLPSKFLLGGNIHDPLNLNSLSDEKAAELMNSVTPESSPLATPKHRKLEYKIEVLIPPNISDPLNLNAQDDSDFESKLVSPMSKKKKVRHRKRPKKSFPALDLANLPGPVPLKPPKTTDIPVGGKAAGITSTAAAEISSASQPSDKAKEETSKDCSKSVIKEKGANSEGRFKEAGSKNLKTQQKNKERFQYGNYNQYYGYRNPGQADDMRLKYFKDEWFNGKQVLDIGCNIGHITISVAKSFAPCRVVGLDIDNQLINIARKNIRHYMDTRPDKKTRYPRMFGRQFGALNPLGVDQTGNKIKEFPHNVEFFAANFVPESDAFLETVQPEFDTILCLSTTKWMHLNHGDEGLKRAFRKMHASLKQGGILILEAQPFSNYGKRKKLTETIFKNYNSIKFRPEAFPDFLLHDIGFARCDVIALPSHPSKGFQRPLQVFTKLGGSGEISSSTTPLSFGISPHTYNPAFTPFYGKFTPGSAGYTPRDSGASNEGETPKSPGGTNQEATVNPEFLYPGPSHLYSGPHAGGYSANSTPSGSYTPGYTPGYPGSTPQGGYSANSTPSHTPTQYPSSSSSAHPIVYTGPSSAFSTPGNVLSSPIYGRTSGGRSPATDEAGGVSSTLAPNNTPAALPPSPSPPSLASGDQTPSYTPRYTPSYTPAHSHSQGSTPVYTGQVNSPGPLSPGGGAPSPGPSSPLYSPGNATPLVSYSPSQYSPDTIGPGYSPSAPDTAGPGYSPSASDSVGPGYSPSGPGYSPSAPYSPHSPAYSPNSPGYSPSSAGFSMSSPGSYQAPSYSPGPQYSPGNATPIPTLSPRNPFYSPVAAPAQDISPVPSPSLQGAEVSGNTTPHPGLEDSPHHLQSIASSVPRYSWSGGNPSGRTTPIIQEDHTREPFVEKSVTTKVASANSASPSSAFSPDTNAGAELSPATAAPSPLAPSMPLGGSSDSSPLNAPNTTPSPLQSAGDNADLETVDNVSETVDNVSGAADVNDESITVSDPPVAENSKLAKSNVHTASVVGSSPAENKEIPSDKKSISTAINSGVDISPTTVESPTIEALESASNEDNGSHVGNAGDSEATEVDTLTSIEKNSPTNDSDDSPSVGSQNSEAATAEIESTSAASNAESLDPSTAAANQSSESTPNQAANLRPRRNKNK